MDRMTFLVTGVLVLAAAPASHADSFSELARWRPLIAEASMRFGIPKPWILAVMQAESSGNPRSLSPKGAMGLMQLMPRTWQEMRAQHRLGDDPWSPRDNVLAGTAYLRAMQDRYGYPALFAAYNAGPSRVEDSRKGRALPNETRTYVAAVTRMIGVMTEKTASHLPTAPHDHRLFVLLTDSAGPQSAATNGLFFPLKMIASGGLP